MVLNNTYLSNSNEKLIENGFPTIYKINGGKLEYYNGPDRMASSFEKWINEVV
jgi:predicted sulfurtransferase